jgi:hypothetical protein
MYSINVKLITLFFLVHLIACNDAADERHKTLAGKWFLFEAEADGEPTDRLEGTIYEFDNGKIKTNVPQIGEGSYFLDKKKLLQQGEHNISYMIEELSENRLVLTMSMRDIPFRLAFSRDSLSNGNN